MDLEPAGRSDCTDGEQDARVRYRYHYLRDLRRIRTTISHQHLFAVAARSRSPASYRYRPAINLLSCRRRTELRCKPTTLPPLVTDGRIPGRSSFQYLSANQLG